MKQNSPNRITAILNDLNESLDKKVWFSLYLSLFIALVFSLLFFNVGVNEGGDDSGYVLRAMRLWKQGVFPNFQGPVYPVILAPFYGLFNGNLILLKMISVPMFLGSLYFIFRTFRTAINPLPFLILLLTLSVNFYWLSYASLTYSEALYNFIQFGLIFFFYQRFICREAILKDIVLLTLLGILLIKTRSIGASIFVAVFIYFLIQRQWKNLLHFSWISFTLLILMEIVSYFLFAENGPNIIYQVEGLLRGNPYDKSQGFASLKLIMERLAYNFNEYVSDHTMQFLALRKTGSLDASWIYTIIASLLSVAAVFLNKTRSKLISFSAIYILIVLIVVFITPKMWSQGRFIQPLIPLIYIVLIAEIQQIAKQKSVLIPVIVISLLLVLQLSHTIHFAKDNIRIINAYQNGDKYFGHNPDWQNYFRVCEWIGENTMDDNDRIACRKPQIAALLSGKDIFYGIYKVPAHKCSEIKHILENKDEKFIAIDMVKFFETPVPEQISEVLRHSYTGGVLNSAKSTNYSLFNIKDTATYSRIIQVNDKLNFVMPMNTLVSDNNNFSIAFADSLLKILEEQHISHLMLANLRAIPERRTEEVLSSVHNFKKAIEIKYPALFKEVFQIGRASLEPTTIYKIDYAAKEFDGQVPVYVKPASTEGDFSSMCEWAIKNSEAQENILCSSIVSTYKGPENNRLVSASSLPRMNYDEFMKIYKPNSNFLIINPGEIDVNQIEDELSSELFNSFCGIVYIGNYTLRLHHVGSHGMYQKIIENKYINQSVLSFEALLNFTDEQKRSFSAVEPRFMLIELKRNNIHYIVEDNLIEDNNQNIPRAMVFLIKSKYPNAFIKMKEMGSSDTDKITLYKINYQVLQP